ncbi:DUF5017 domain-containing protein [Chitinophaga alhagiae]|uniref:DUF5017 domain-containing protein n=1 Tax=Chitinophaga alhagiae TaxID=2203219 RepID=UPI00130018F4|nr:DUF5017 domain-containing protein [Chitinophaga alhagiae]
MKRSIFIITAGLSLVAAACNKDMQVDTPSFSVHLDPARLVADTFTYRAGDTTRFIFSGNADNIAFYSGETGKKYANRQVAYQLGNVSLSFSSKAEWGNQANTLTVLATNNLTAFDSTAIVDAAWTDITSRVKLATNATVVASGEADLTDLVSNEKDSLFIAFKYSGVTGSTQRTWTITNYAVKNTVNGEAYTASALATDVSFWTRLGNVKTPASAIWAATSSDLKIIGGNGAAPTNTSWIISKPIYAGRIPPDVSTPVKSIVDPAKTGHAYSYAKAGIYKATFVAFNHTLDDEKSVVKEFIIKVIP